MNKEREDEKKSSPAGDATDGRASGEWRSRYPAEAQRQYYMEAGYTLAISISAIALLFCTWSGSVATYLGISGDAAVNLRNYAYFAFAGMLGGTVFGIKYLYRVVARGYWHEDRRLWRLLSPWLSLCVAVVFGTLIEADWISLKGIQSGAGRVAIGFLVGYFSDSALAKMHELAEVIFGPSKRSNEGNKDK